MKTKNDENMPEKIRPASKAGTWYEGNAKRLRQEILALFKAIEPKKPTGHVRALISPHAGYVYSAKTAAHGFSSILHDNIERVIVLAPSHYERFKGGSIPDATHYETPLGKVPLDRSACDLLLSGKGFFSSPSAHTNEHSLELQLPFLQVALERGFSLIPILTGEIKPGLRGKMAEQLLPLWDDNTLVVVSSDFTHYGPNFGYVPFADKIRENLEELDLGAARITLDLDHERFDEYIEKTGATICGRGSIALFLCMAASREVRGKILKYTTSGDMTGDFSNSVSYASICFTAGEKQAAHSSGSDG